MPVGPVQLYSSLFFSDLIESVFHMQLCIPSHVIPCHSTPRHAVPTPFSMQPEQTLQCDAIRRKERKKIQAQEHKQGILCQCWANARPTPTPAMPVTCSKKETP